MSEQTEPSSVGKYRDFFNYKKKGQSFKLFDFVKNMNTEKAETQTKVFGL